MAEATNSKHPVVNLDEFERRLRGPEPMARDNGDPLAELARLVNGDGKQNAVDPVSNLFSRSNQRVSSEGGSSVVQMPRATWDRTEPGFGAAPTMDAIHLQEELRGSLHGEDPQIVFEREMREMHAKYDPPAAVKAAHIQSHDTEGHDKIAAALPTAGTASSSASQSVLSAQDSFAGGSAMNLPEPQAMHHFGHSGPAEHFEQETGAPVWQDMPPAVVLRAKPKRGPVYVMSAIAAVGLALVGGSFAWRANSASSPHPIAVIKATEGPVKVAAANSDGMIVPNQDASILDKTQGAGKATSKVAATDEQPIDLNLVPKTGAAPQAAQPVVKLVQPPSATSGGASVATESPFGTPKRVKTVAVRPDGSVISGPAETVTSLTVGSAASAPLPAARPAAFAQGVTAPSVAPATPAVAVAPPKPKATVRVATAIKPEAKQEVKPAALVPPPAAAIANDLGDAPLQLGGVPAKVRPNKIRVADATPAVSPEPTASTGGRFAVQLAAPGSEQEAKDASARFSRQFSGQLDGRTPTVRAGENAGRTVYRVRVGNLSRDEATAMCTKLKSNGGSCFVASN